MMFSKMFLGLTGLVCLACFGLALPSHADVNLLEASYQKQFTDFELSSADGRFQFRRTYRSRSIHQGLFGFGWCTDFEKRIHSIASDTLVIEDCQEMGPLKFKKDGNSYVSLIDGTDRITSSKGNYLRKISRGHFQTYDSQGRLILITNSKESIRLVYNEFSQIEKIIFNKIIISLKFTPKDGGLLKVTAPGKAALVYKIRNRNLIEVEGLDSLPQKFIYDQRHNLVEIWSGKTRYEKMTYDMDKDWLISLQNSPRCMQNFEYKIISATRRLFETRVRKICDGKAETQSSYKYQLKEVSPSQFRAIILQAQTPRLKNRISNKSEEDI